MSVQAISWALDHRVHSVTEKVILLVLANYANEYGISWPSQRTLAENAACDERTVRRTLVSLEARGVIRRIARRRGNGSRQSDMILMSAFTGRKPAAPGMLDDDEKPAEPGPADEPPASATGQIVRLPTGHCAPTPRALCPPLNLH
jgi:DNA-binding transcriptional MocR family regulator